MPFPIVDFQQFLKGNPAEKQTIGNQVLDAFTGYGFLYLANHGIPNTTLSTVFEHSKQFFALPFSDKNKLSWTNPAANRGYVAPGREKVTQLKDTRKIAQLRETAPDMKESFEIGREPSNDFQNNWPTHTPDFQRVMMNFFESGHLLHLQVMDAIGLGLGFSSKYFDQFCDAKDHNLRLLHYPSVSKSLLDTQGQTRAGAHTDYGTITLLFQDDKGGLQVRNQQGEFIDAPPIPDTIVINAGDLLSRWSNDIIKSTEHQVISPRIAPSTQDYPDRYSIAYFCNPNFDSMIECLDGCWTDKNPKKYKAVKSHDYLVSRLKATY